MEYIPYNIAFTLSSHTISVVKYSYTVKMAALWDMQVSSVTYKYSENVVDFYFFVH